MSYGSRPLFRFAQKSDEKKLSGGGGGWVGGGGGFVFVVRLYSPRP
jgi:hypothetical protein